MKLKTILGRINLLEKEGKISIEDGEKIRVIISKIWEAPLVNHHLTGEKDATPHNKIKIKGELHYMIHQYAYRFIVNNGLLKNFLLWLKETFGTEIEELMEKIKDGI